MQIHLVSGFLGSGKTTAIQTACKVLMSEGYKVGVITNDQGIRLVDTGFFESVPIPTRQVADGCFCCHYQALETRIQSLIEASNPDVIFAESVGSCTDIVATVVKPLQRFHKNIRVTVSTFADVRLLCMILNETSPLFDDNVTYIYRKQLEDAGILVINKTDLVSPDELMTVQQTMQEKYPGKRLLFINSLDAENVQLWLHALQDKKADKSLPSLEIDYDTYGTGEAMLAWLDEELELYSSQATATEDAIRLAEIIYQKIMSSGLLIGHVKFLMNDNIKISYTATTQTAVHSTAIKEASKATLLINARVQTTPGVLQQFVDNAVAEMERESGCSIIVNSVSSFQPGYPKPTHRIVG